MKKEPPTLSEIQSTTALDVSHVNAVKTLYERRPYPHYPLLAKPNWQDGFLSSSLFAQGILENQTRSNLDSSQFLSVGCGEILPYILRKWESPQTNLFCNDLSRRSICRAKFRTMFLRPKTNYILGDINEYLVGHGNGLGMFDQIEAFGVLHHIPNFNTTLKHLGQRLSDRGTIRMMVYNSFARQWIKHISHGFSHLGLSYKLNHDIDQARNILMNFVMFSPRLRQKINQLGKKSLENNTRFADTFMHPWESRASISDWYESASAAGLKIIALYDRYAELDDLPNPLWFAPSAEQLEERAIDYRFENNLEIWLASKSCKPQNLEPSSSISKVPWNLRMTMPPSHFDRFEETRNFSTLLRIEIWQGFLKSVHGIYDTAFIQKMRTLDLQSGRRLARMGLILPGIAKKAGLYDQFLEPMAKSMDPPTQEPKMNVEMICEIQKICNRYQLNEKRRKLAVQRFLRVL